MVAKTYDNFTIFPIFWIFLSDFRSFFFTAFPYSLKNNAKRRKRTSDFRILQPKQRRLKEKGNFRGYALKQNISPKLSRHHSSPFTSTSLSIQTKTVIFWKGVLCRRRRCWNTTAGTASCPKVQSMSILPSKLFLLVSKLTFVKDVITVHSKTEICSISHFFVVIFI